MTAAQAPTEVMASTPPGSAPPSARPPAAGSPAQLYSRHTWLIRSILGLAAVLSVLGIFAVWANRQLLDTSSWTKTSSRLLENHAIQGELSSYLTEQLYDNVNVAGELRTYLPGELKPLAGPAASGLRTVIEKGVVLALQQQRVQELWRTANGVAHKQLINLVENKNSVIRTPGQGTVYLDLRPIVSELASRLGAPASTAEKIPANIARVKIVKAKSLETAQTAVRVLRALALVLPLLVLLLFAGALGLARDRRARTLVNIGIVCVGAGVVTLIARSIAGTQVVNTLATTEAVRPAASAAWSIGTSLLVDVAVGLIFLGVFVFLAGLLAGSSRWARATRRGLAPYLRDRPDIAFGIVAVALLILFLWGPIYATQTLIGILLITVLVLFGTQMLRRQTALEFPDAPSAAVEMDAVRDRLAGMWGSLVRGGSSLRAGIGERMGGGEEGRDGGTPRASGRAGGGEGGGEGGYDSGVPVAGGDSVDKLERLAALHSSGALTDEEFAAAKRELLSR